MSVKRNQKIIRHAHRILALQGPSIRTTQANTIRFPRGILQLENSRLASTQSGTRSLSSLRPPRPLPLLSSLPNSKNKLQDFTVPQSKDCKSRRFFLGLRSARSIFHIVGSLRGLRSLTDLRMILTPGKWNTSGRFHGVQ